MSGEGGEVRMRMERAHVGGRIAGMMILRGVARGEMEVVIVIDFVR